MGFSKKSILNKKLLCLFVMTLGLGSLLCSCQIGKTSKAALEGPLLAVLCSADQGTAKWKGVLSPSAIHVINIETQAIAHKIVTRSPADSFAFGTNGKLYASNTGGLGNDADKAIGVIEPRQGKVEGYIELDIVPGEIIAAGNDLFVTSGLYRPQTDEITWNKINPLNNKITPIKIPGVTFSPVYHSGKIYVSTTIVASKHNQDNPLSVSQVAPNIVPPSRDEGFIRSLLLIDSSTLDVQTMIGKEGDFGKEIAFDEGGNAFGLISRSTRKDVYKDVLVVFRPDKNLIVKAIPMPPQLEPAYRMIYHKGKLYVSYYNSNSMKGSVVAVYDAENYQLIKTIEGFSGPVDMLVEEGKLFVLCNGNSNKTDGEVAIVDIESLQVVNRISVGRDPKRLEYIPRVNRTS